MKNTIFIIAILLNIFLFIMDKSNVVNLACAMALLVMMVIDK
jgi:hypothetical protein